jgi:hypothetical protein
VKLLQELHTEERQPFAVGHFARIGQDTATDKSELCILINRNARHPGHFDVFCPETNRLISDVSTGRLARVPSGATYTFQQS